MHAGWKVSNPNPVNGSEGRVDVVTTPLLLMETCGIKMQIAHALHSDPDLCLPHGIHAPGASEGGEDIWQNVVDTPDALSDKLAILAGTLVSGLFLAGRV